MQKFVPLCLAAISAVIVTAALSFVPVAQAADPTPQRLQLLSERCNVLKTRLIAIQKTEAADRIRRGRAYDQELLPYISAFNSRIAANKVDAPELIRIAAELQQAVGREQFGSQYSVYYDDLNSAVHSDCKTSPASTNDWLDKSRIDRATLAGTVKTVDELITEYITELSKLEQRYTPIINQTTDTPPQE